jgi:hypothetical protein
MLLLLLFLVVDDNKFIPVIPNSNPVVADFGFESNALCELSFHAVDISCLGALAAMIPAI